MLTLNLIFDNLRIETKFYTKALVLRDLVLAKLSYLVFGKWRKEWLYLRDLLLA